MEQLPLAIVYSVAALAALAVAVAWIILPFMVMNRLNVIIDQNEKVLWQLMDLNAQIRGANIVRE